MNTVSSKMIRIETLSDQTYQTIYSTENDCVYQDLIKYIKK